MTLRLTISLTREDPTGSRTVTYFPEENGVAFEEQDNGVLVLSAGDNWLRRFNPNAWQSYTLEVIDE